MMRTSLLSAFLIVLAAASVFGQKPLPADTVVRTNHSSRINGVSVSYTASKGMQPVWNSEGKAIATLDYTFYERTDVTNKEKRPLVISFNGGPGSASVWMEIAYTGPALLHIDDEGYPVQPYGIGTNPYSILDVADIVFINPVNTGFSRILDREVDKSVFFGTNADIRYLANWIETFVTRQDRWRSPKYLIGESYGTTRVSGLAHELQSNHWMYLNGVVLVSPTELGIKREGPVEMALRLPYYAATAWYHKVLPADLQSKTLESLLPEVEEYAVNVLLPHLVRGGALSADSKREIATQFARYSGLDTELVLQNNLDVSTNLFWKALLRDKGYTVGRLDSRYLGIDRKDAGDRPDFNAELNSWLHSFTPAINTYLRNELKFPTDVSYKMFGSVHPWDRSNDRTGESLRQAMAQNPYLHVMVQSGYFDGACDYFNAKYNLWQMDPSGRLQDRMSFVGYHSGHMMYLRKEDLKKGNQDIRDFIQRSTPAEGVPAKYSIED